MEEHINRLALVFNRLRKYGLNFNKHKCVFAKSQITYLGHLITSEGLKPDPTKVEAISQMPLPKCKPDLQRLLGMTNYLCKFLPNYTEVTTPLRQLLQKDVKWSFDKPQIEAANNLKK